MSLLGSGVVFGVLVLAISVYWLVAGMVILAAGVLAAVGIGWQRSRPTRHPGRVQVWFSADGCGQQDHLAGPSAWDLILIALRWIAIFCVGALLVRRWESGHQDWVPILVGAAYAVRQGFRWVHEVMRRGRRTTNGVSLTPWTQVHEVELRAEGSDRHRLRCSCESVWIFENDPVDADVVCNKQQAEELRKRIDGWRAGIKEK